MKLCAVVAAWDERDNAGPLARRLLNTLRGMEGWTFELLFVVEGTDGTREALAALGAPEIRILYGGATPGGLGAAFRRGFAAVPPDVDVVVTLDADLNHRPEEIPRLVAALASSAADVVVGSRWVPGATVAGMSLWKRLVSRSVGLLTWLLYGLEVRDKSSGFRVYRRAALDRIAFANDDFAFLPEILLRATQQGLRIQEEPIAFAPRATGRSKMDLPRTCMSYLALLRTAFTPWPARAALCLLLAGLLLRVFTVYPSWRDPAEADDTLTGLTALRILQGDFHVFYAGGLRNGAFESYLHAVTFALFGVSRATMFLAPLLVSWTQLGVYLLLVRELLDRSGAVWAFAFMALPAPFVLYWTLVPVGYGSGLLFGSLALWCAARLVRSGAEWQSELGLGLAAGLGWWTSPLTLAATVPAAVWAVLLRPGLLRRPRCLGLAAAGGLLGSAPWWLFNLRHDWASLRDPVIDAPRPGLGQVFGNLRFVLTKTAPRWALDPFYLGEPALRHSTGRWLAGGLYLAALVTGLTVLAVMAWRRRSAARAELLGFLILAALVLLIACSPVGNLRSDMTRYFLPAALAAPLLLARLCERIGARSRAAALLCAAALIVFNLTGVPLRGEYRREKTELAASEDRLIGLLERRGTALVLGQYWHVFPVNLLSRERVRAVSPGIDFNGSLDFFGAAPVPLALVSRRPGEVAAWSAAAGLTGRIERIGTFDVFFPVPDPPTGEPAAALAQRLLAALPAH